jgi:glycosyltransferase involved in cell wall biosynthesis
VLPSRKESFGIVLLEAGAFGVPVIASRVGGIPEIIEDGITGLLVPAEDAVALAECMTSVLSSTDFAESMGARLRQHVEANFAWSSALEKYSAFVDSAKH